MGHQRRGRTRTIGLAAWQSTMADVHRPLSIATTDSSEFNATIVEAVVGGIEMSTIAATSHRVSSTERHPYTGDPQYMFHLQIEGQSTIAQAGRTAVLTPGDFAAYDPALPCECDFPGDFAILVACVPQQLISLPPRALAELAARRMPGTDGLGALASAFMLALARDLESFGASAFGNIVARTLQELLTGALGEVLGASARQSPGAQRLEEVIAIRDWIMVHLGEPELSLERIAAAHFISVRKLQGLFFDDGTTVMEWVRSRRLEMARQDLTAPRRPGESIAEVAERWGFADPSYFARTFRGAYGVTPREYRKSESAR